MLLPKQILGFFGYQDIWNIFDFFIGGIHWGKEASETIAFGWVCPGIPSHAKNCLHVVRIPLWLFLGNDQIKDQLIP